MNRQTTILAGLALALTVSAAGCSDDAQAPPAPDQGPAGDLTTGADLSPPGDTGGVADRGASADIGPQADAGATGDGGAAPKNSGAICNGGKPCPAGETCTYFGAQNGMCLAGCKNQGDPCPVVDKTKQLSTCSIKGLDPTKWYCGYFCEIGGKKYECPSVADFACVASSNPSFKFCEPK